MTQVSVVQVCHNHSLDLHNNHHHSPPEHAAGTDIPLNTPPRPCCNLYSLGLLRLRPASRNLDLDLDLDLLETLQIL